MKSLLQELALSQNSAANYLNENDLLQAHIHLKKTTIKIFENSGERKTFDLQTGVRLFCTFFRVAFYLRNDQGDFAYRYRAIPGQLGNACYFQLRLSQQDASGYDPPYAAMKECATAAHRLLEQYATEIIVQTPQERNNQIGRAYKREDVVFAYDKYNFPVVQVDSHKSKIVDFSRPRVFDFELFCHMNEEEDFIQNVEKSMKFFGC